MKEEIKFFQNRYTTTRILTSMKISIIIPCFNTGYLLNNLTESILQSRQSVEIIIIDDCSKDESFEIATQLAKKHQGIISVYKTEKNSGPGIARNIGIENATGEYLWFIDSDDLLSPSALLILENYIEKEKKILFHSIGNFLII